MQPADQTGLSLRAGGGRGRLGGGSRFESSSSSASSSSSSSFALGSFSSDLPLLRPHGGSPPSFSINGGHTPALVEAEVPWSARSGSLSEKDSVLKTVKGILNKLTIENFDVLILNKLTPENFDVLKGQPIDPALETELVPSSLTEFVRLLQGESPREDFSHLVDGEARPADEVINVFKRAAADMTLASELVRLRAQFVLDQQTISNLKSRVTTLEIQLGDYKDLLSFKEKRIISLEDELTTLKDQNKSLVYHPEVVKEAISLALEKSPIMLISGKTCALLQGNSAPPARPSNYGFGAETAAQVARPVPPAASVPPVVEKPQAPALGMSPAALQKKTVSLLEEYFSILMLDEALQCIEELKSPAYHPEVIKEAISLALEKNPPHVDPTVRLLEYLSSKKVFTARDIGTGCLLYAALLDDVRIDFPRAPSNFGEIIGELLLIGSLDFKVVMEVLKKVEDDYLRRTIFNVGMHIVNASPSGQALLEAQASDIEACRSLL